MDSPIRSARVPTRMDTKDRTMRTELLYPAYSCYWYNNTYHPDVNMREQDFGDTCIMKGLFGSNCTIEQLFDALIRT